MTVPLMSPVSSVRVREGRPIVGVDLSTLRCSAGILTHVGMAWKTKTLQRVDSIPLRCNLAADDLGDFLAKLEIDYGLPAALGLEIPLAGPNTPLPSFWMVGAFYVALGDVYGARVPVIEFGPGAWKKPSTGRGIAANLPKTPKGATKTEAGRVRAERRRIEKARIMAWAHDVMGYPSSASLEDEADATGVCVATALRAARR